MWAGGCFFWLPFVPEAQNVAPTIERSDPPPGTPVVMNTETVVVFVVVEDDNDPESLEYIWTVEGLGEQGVAQPINTGTVYGSRLTLQRNEVYDGRTLRCWVYDSFGESDDRDWIISVPEEAR